MITSVSTITEKLAAEQSFFSADIDDIVYRDRCGGDGDRSPGRIDIQDHPSLSEMPPLRIPHDARHIARV